MLYISLGLNLLLVFIITISFIKKNNKSIETIIQGKLDLIEKIEKDVRDLNNTFTMPYLRGEAGETLLKELIKNYLPQGSYQFQYGFKGGQKVDAIIKTGKYIIPIDSKFPIQSIKETESGILEISKSSKRVFYKYAEDISNKYINPTEGTLNFAIMYIPSEKLYYRFFIEGNGELSNELLRLGILPSSPSTLFSYIQTVVYGLKGFTFNEKQNEILEKIEALKINYSKLKRQYSTVNTHLKNLNLSLNGFEKLIDQGQSTIPD